MVIGRITSGLGNQLFQYAIARHLSILNKASLYFDLSYYKYQYETDTPRVFKLHNFKIDYKLLDNSPLLYASKATKLFPERTLKPVFELVKEKHFHVDPEVLKARAKLLILDGFWQSEKYFSPAAAIIRKELVFTNQPGPAFEKYKNEIARSANPISIHIRRGDYVNNAEFSQSFGFIGIDYYHQAIKLIKRQFTDFRFFVFSDDQEWTEKNFDLSSDTVFVKNIGENSDLDDLHLMSLCKHHVIANSSFSWWGAWLNADPNKMVITPKNWFKNKPDWHTTDLIPDSWLSV
ncbi:alpha-1,2-fucosyltransferase [Tellurirhabdus bombi]|uniref:alpha-1,2-fucosyltransferase n=1 Tax=Tellurirhabdus bombi TaxID=2907205 RepID=UPI001F402B2C|nr:alpha-1,2-fucosyltransferase [Tellurirhabdus bombi]